MKKLPEATAIFAANDEMAMGVIMAALNDGKKIPDEIAIAGYDNIRFQACSGQALQLSLHLLLIWRITRQIFSSD